MTDDQRQHLAAILDDMDAAKQHVAAARRALDAIGPAPEPAAQSIVLPLPPSGNRYWRHYNGRTVVSDAAKAYRHGVMLQAQAHNLRPFAGPVAVYVRVYRARKAGDLDNFKKVLYDALQGVAYNDDDQIVEEHAWRYDDKDNPRVEVEVRQVQP